MSVSMSINRIRLEFKDRTRQQKPINKRRINRIRLEFKVVHRTFHKTRKLVLIESDWNLKNGTQQNIGFQTAVLIESDWNLKRSVATSTNSPSSINRIRLEFKA